MIRILKMKHLQWRNVCSREPVIVGELALGGAFNWTAARLPASIVQLMQEKLFGLRMETLGADAAQLCADIAQELQAAGDVTNRSCGVITRDATTRTAMIFFSYRDPFLAQAILVVATNFVSKICRLNHTVPQLSEQLDRCIQAVTRIGLSQSTRAIVAAAEKRGIPWFRMSHMSQHVQFGQGAEQRRIGEIFGSDESYIGGNFSRNKLLTLTLLGELQLPVGLVAAVTSEGSALRTANAIGYPIIVKPVHDRKAGWAFLNLRNPEELKAALLATRSARTQFLLQSFLPGDEHQLLVLGGQFVAGARITRTHVTGDGKLSIAQLVNAERRNSRSGPGFTEGPNAIWLDTKIERVLAQQGLTREDIPSLGQSVRICSADSIGIGGLTIDVTEIVHPDIVGAAERAAKAVGSRVASVAFISPDITRSWRDVGGGICGVNSAVRLRPQWAASPLRDVRSSIIESIYPKGKNGRILTAMITGSVGKTTTSLMLRSILAAAGHVVGAATTEGATVGNEKIMTGDVAGTNGAAVVLRDPMVTAAVLETARGDLLKTGMYLDRCDVAALLNVGREQIGMDGIDTLDQMAEHKRKVVDSASAAAVLNADDERCLAVARDIRGRTRTILFSTKPESPDIREHMEWGGEVVLLRSIDGAKRISIECTNKTIPIAVITDIPATMGGLIVPNVWNAMAACGLAIGLGVEVQHIAQGLRQFQNTYASSRGRFNFPDGFPVKILFDRAFSPPALTAAVSVVNAIKVTGKRICATAVPGNRPTWTLDECASRLAGHFDRYVCYELTDRQRRNPEGRTPGEWAERMAHALAIAGVDVAAIKVVKSRKDAAFMIAHEARVGDFVAIFGPGKSIEEYRAAFANTARTVASE